MTGTDQDSPPALRPATPAAPVRHRPPRSIWLRRFGRSTGRISAATGRALHRWALRPAGRFALPALALAAVLAMAASAGGYLIPATAPSKPMAQPSTTDPDLDSVPSGAPGALDPTAMPAPGSSDGTVDPTAASRPVDLLTNWAQKLSPVVGIPVVALKAYGYAQLWSQQSQPSCHLTWTTLAGIGKVESDHGQEGGTILMADGHALPPILGPVLNGSGGTTPVPDHDDGQYDNNTVYDRAVGPMQFIPSTWDTYQVDADQDGVADPNDINDAALAAANYLCAGQRNLSVPGQWWAGILHYNNVQTYADNVFAAANEYGELSRTAA